MSVTIYVLWREKNARIHFQICLNIDDIFSCCLKTPRKVVNLWRKIPATHKNWLLSLKLGFCQSIFLTTWLDVSQKTGYCLWSYELLMDLILKLVVSVLMRHLTLFLDEFFGVIWDRRSIQSVYLVWCDETFIYKIRCFLLKTK